LALAFALLTIMPACGGGTASDAQPLDAATFQEAHDELGTLIEEAQAGDPDGAQEAFARALATAGPVDRVLAGLPEQVIVRADLLDVMVRIEMELASTRRTDVLAELAEEMRRALADAAEALGLERPSES
jgi:hypothetical protein